MLSVCGDYRYFYSFLYHTAITRCLGKCSQHTLAQGFNLWPTIAGAVIDQSGGAAEAVLTGGCQAGIDLGREQLS